jgi:hypothetical protein
MTSITETRVRETNIVQALLVQPSRDGQNVQQANGLAATTGLAGPQVWDQPHRIVLEELSEAQPLDWLRGCIDTVVVRAKRGT